MKVVHRTDILPDDAFAEIAEPGTPGRDSNVPGPPGRDGQDSTVPGPPGVGFRWRGSWRRKAEYIVNDVIEHEGSTYVATADTRGKEPPGRGWGLMCAAGADGRDGLDGVSQRGPRGLPGETIVVGGSVELPEFTFDDDAAAGQVVRVSGNRHVALADADNFPHAVGFALTGVSSGGTGEVLTDGELQLPDWAAVLESGDSYLEPGEIYYLSAVPGKITADAPADGGLFVTRLGVASGNTTLSVEIEAAIGLSGNTGDGEQSELLEAVYTTGAELGMPLYVDGDGTVDLADASTEATATVAGLSAEETTATAVGHFKSYGTLAREDWSDVLDTGIVLVPGSRYYLATTAGKLTLTPPSEIGQSVVLVGLALTESVLLVQIEPPMLLN